MKQIIINGNKSLSGTIKISGAKNSVVALIPTAILADEPVSIFNVPDISDTKALIEILDLLNCASDYENEQLDINPVNMKNILIPEEKSSRLRASYYFMGALLGKYKKVEMYFPGGCNIGARPIDLHLKGFEKLGAKIEVEGDKFLITAEKLVGNKIYLDFASVGATINIMLAAVKAEGQTIITNVAKEPEIVNVATFLNNMGAKISGAGTSEIRITGVDKLCGAVIEAIPDRIETGTYVIAGALIGQELTITNIISEHIEALLSKLREMNVNVSVKNNEVVISKSDNLLPVNIKTLVYPGFPTDLGQPIAVLLSQAKGMSIFEETLFENRMGHIKYLQKMGANIKVSGQTAIFNGPNKFIGQEVVAVDLRGGAAMVLAGLCANGQTTINEVEHILRGYENIVEKLRAVGADIRIQETN